MTFSFNSSDFFMKFYFYERFLFIIQARKKVHFEWNFSKTPTQSLPQVHYRHLTCFVLKDKDFRPNIWWFKCVRCGNNDGTWQIWSATFLNLWAVICLKSNGSKSRADLNYKFCESFIQFGLRCCDNNSWTGNSIEISFCPMLPQLFQLYPTYIKCHNSRIGFGF